MAKRKPVVPTEPVQPQGLAVWASRNFLSPLQKEWTAHLTMCGALSHWSRIFEYPWIMANGAFTQDCLVLDAAGGDAPLQVFVSQKVLQVINIDLDNTKRPSVILKNILFAQGDLRSLPINDNTFDRVICASVMEHIENPNQALAECMRVLKPGGRLIGSFDVAEYSRYNHSIDMYVAESLLGMMDLKLPPEPELKLTMKFEEIEPQEDEPKEVELSSICFWWDKK